MHTSIFCTSGFSPLSLLLRELGLRPSSKCTPKRGVREIDFLGVIRKEDRRFIVDVSKLMTLLCAVDDTTISASEFWWSSSNISGVVELPRVSGDWELRIKDRTYRNY